jgi:hypothetical protein
LRDEFIANNLDDLLGRRKRGHHGLADGLFADVLDQLLDDAQVDVGFKQGNADFAQRLADIFLGNCALAAKGLEGTLQLIG